MDFENYMVVPWNLTSGVPAPPPVSTFQRIEREADVLVPIKVDKKYNVLTLTEETVVTYRSEPTEEARLAKELADEQAKVKSAYAAWTDALRRSVDARERLRLHRESKGR